MKRNFVNINEQQVPIIKGAGGGGGGNAGGYNEEPNSLFATDILFATIALGEGPLYRINPNGPQDIEVSDSSIDDLIKINGDGSENPEVFKTLSTTGTLTQNALTKFGEQTISPQLFASPVNLKKGNVDGVPKTEILLQDTSSSDWDELKFNFVVNALQKQQNDGNIVKHTITVRVRVYDNTGTVLIREKEHTVKGKTTVPYKFS